ncbi:MAG: hypothetical protein WC597_14695 [Brevundimonas sp.]
MAVLAGLAGQPETQTVRVEGADLADMQCVVVAMETVGVDETQNVATVSNVTFYMGKLAGRGNVNRWDRVLVGYRSGLSDAEKAKMVEDHGVRCTLEALVASMGFAQLALSDATAAMAKPEN